MKGAAVPKPGGLGAKPKTAPAAKGSSAAPKKQASFTKAFAKAAADVAAERKPVAKRVKAKGKKAVDAKYKNLIDPRTKEQKKKEYLEAFERIKDMSMADMQVELIVCIRAEHYRDALMYSQIILEKDPTNALVGQFQPLLASLSVQANKPLDGSSSEGDTDSEGETGDEDLENIGQGVGDMALGGEEGEGGESDEDSDDPENAWMWSDTWRTDS